MPAYDDNLTKEENEIRFLKSEISDLKSRLKSANNDIELLKDSLQCERMKNERLIGELNGFEHCIKLMNAGRKD